MLYFAFGSNLNQKQMKKRCKDSKYIGCYSLKNYKLVINCVVNLFKRDLVVRIEVMFVNASNLCLDREWI